MSVSKLINSESRVKCEVIDESEIPLFFFGGVFEKMYAKKA